MLCDCLWSICVVLIESEAGRTFTPFLRLQFVRDQKTGNSAFSTRIIEHQIGLGASAPSVLMPALLCFDLLPALELTCGDDPPTILHERQDSSRNGNSPKERLVSNVICALLDLYFKRAGSVATGRLASSKHLPSPPTLQQSSDISTAPLA